MINKINGDKINSKVFDYVSTSTDNTKVDIFNKPERLGSEDVHNTLSLIGMIPGIGEPADALDSFLYATEGKYKDAAISLASMIPIIGGAKNSKKLLDFAISTRTSKVNKLADEMVDKGYKWNKTFDRPGSLSKPLKGKYKEIPILRKEIDMLNIEKERNRYKELLGRVPNLPELRRK